MAKKTKGKKSKGTAAIITPAGRVLQRPGYGYYVQRGLVYEFRLRRGAKKGHKTCRRPAT